MSTIAPRRLRPIGEQATVELEGLAAASFPCRACVLTVLEGPDQGQSFHFTKRSIRIGSDLLNDVVLSDPTVSRRHAELSLHEQGYQLLDLGSTNGTFVSGHRVSELLLDDRTVVHFGKSGLSFNMKVEVANIEPSRDSRFGEIVGASEGLRQIFTVLEKIAPTPLHVLVTGDTGTGKELFARAIHQRSKRAHGPFVVFDCSAFPASLLESELFGHERGAFSGAVQQHKGVFELASGGTLFLDELGEMSVELQPKLLRAIETGEFRRVGGSKSIKVDLRVVAATNRHIENRLEDGSFRRDLYFRLAQVRIHLPPLRDRVGDIELLVGAFLERMRQQDPRRRLPRFSHSAIDALRRYAWPGNVRELRNVIERVVSLCESEVVNAEFVEEELAQQQNLVRSTATMPKLDASSGETLAKELLVSFEKDGALLPLKEAKELLIDELERRYLLKLFEKHQSNLSAAAREAGIDRRHLYRLMKKHGIGREE